MTPFSYCMVTEFQQRFRVPLLHVLIVFLLKGYVNAATTDSTLNSEDDDDSGAPMSMIIGLSVGFGSVCVVVFCCCLIFKCCGCKEENRKTSAVRRKMAWDN
ncbi:uncharacterized protein LOC132715814 [Ruditapes philippinarum]|uniref:uncharacterized protein LOC132715814 n=1 Tax=Ruditapes philippinarum TaxID=129788 RepID=UPI00295C2D53|nr:uncharacterized protein LOC132715814 [Ruditapes philippinarum]